MPGVLRQKWAAAAHARADPGAIIQRGDVIFRCAQIGCDVVQGAERKPEIGSEAGQGLAVDATRQNVPQNGVWEAVRGDGCVDLLHDSRIPQCGFRPDGLGAVKCGGRSLVSLVERARKVKMARDSEATFDLFEAFDDF